MSSHLCLVIQDAGLGLNCCFILGPAKLWEKGAFYAQASLLCLFLRIKEFFAGRMTKTRDS